MTYETPKLGWPLTPARFIRSVLLPPFMRLIGQWLFALFQGWRAYLGAYVRSSFAAAVVGDGWVVA